MSLSKKNTICLIHLLDLKIEIKRFCTKLKHYINIIKYYMKYKKIVSMQSFLKIKFPLICLT